MTFEVFNVWNKNLNDPLLLLIADEHCLRHTLVESVEENIQLRILLKAVFAELVGLS